MLHPRQTVLLGIALLVLLLPAPGGAQTEELTAIYASYTRAIKAGKLEEARRHARRGLELASQELGPTHPQTGVLAYNLGALCAKLERHADALAALTRAVEIYRSVHGERAEQNLAPLRKLAEVHQALKQWQEAERHYVRAVEIIERSRGRDDEEIADILLQLGLVADSLEQHQRVRAYGHRAIHIYEETRGKNDLQIGLIHLGLARNEIAVGDFRKARMHLDVAIPIFESQQLPPGHPQLVSLYTFLADAYKAIGKPAKARKYRKKLKAAQRAASSQG